jgi:protein required for attachment to host cells
MKNTWVLIAHRGGARVFENKGPGKGLILLQDIPHPEGKLKSKDLGSDEPGRSFDSHGARHSFEQEVGPAAHVSEVFARQIAGILEEGRVGHRYGRLVLVAEARFLGILRAALSRETSTLVTATVNKDLGHVETQEVSKHLQDVLPL